MRGPEVLSIEFALTFSQRLWCHAFVIFLVFFGMVLIPLAFYFTVVCVPTGGVSTENPDFKARRALPEQHSIRSLATASTRVTYSCLSCDMLVLIS